MSEEPAEVDVVDRALTVATRSTRRRGRGAEATRKEYAREWGRWCEWRHPLDPTVVSPELLATYASAQCAAGRAVATVRKAVAAIQSELRSRGKTVPDAVPAHVALREIDNSRTAAGRGSKPADPLMLDELVLMLAATDQGTVAGERDAALLHLLFAGQRVGEIEPIDLGDVEVDHQAGLAVTGDERLGAALGMRLAGARWDAIADRAGYASPDEARDVIAAAMSAATARLPTVRVRLRPDEETGRPAQVLTLLHWRSEDGVHDPRLCPVEAVARWALRVASYPGAASHWPLFLPVDASGRIGGLDRGWAGSLGSTGGRLNVSGIHRVFGRALAAAHLEGAGRRIVPLSLKLGGAAARLAQGAPGLGAFAVGAWSPTSRAVVDLLRRYTPPDAGALALTWSLPVSVPAEWLERGPDGVDTDDA